MKYPLTTVILFFNKPTMTARCLARVKEAAALSAGPHHILMVDNGSVESQGQPQVGPQIEIDKTIRLEPNQGFSRGMNAGLTAAFTNPETAFALLLSNDVELAPDFFEKLAQLPLSPLSDDAAIWCPHVYYLSDRTKPSYTHGSLDCATGTLSHHFDTSITEIQFPHYYPAAATLWSRAAYERLGGFDERYFCYWEDVELSHRCQQKGVRLIGCDLKVHHLGRGTTSGKKSYSEHFARGRQLTLDILANQS